MSVQARRFEKSFWVVGLLGAVVAPDANAKVPGGSHSGGGGYHAPHVSAPHVSMPHPQVYHAPKMPQQTHRAPQTPHPSNNANAQAARRNSLAARQAILKNNASRNVAIANHTNARGGNRAPGVAGTTAGAKAGGTVQRTRSVSAYAPYGYRGGVRRNRGQSYGSRYYGRRSRGYGNRNYQAQRFNQMLVFRLRMANRNLSTLDRDYQGHRVRAMRSISMAIRQLGNRSSAYGRTNALGNNAVNGRLANRGGVGTGAGRARISQAQSDARMRHAQRTVQRVQRQLTAHGYTPRHARSLAHVQRSVQELNVALAIR